MQLGTYRGMTTSVFSSIYFGMMCYVHNLVVYYRGPNTMVSKHKLFLWHFGEYSPFSGHVMSTDLRHYVKTLLLWFLSFRPEQSKLVSNEWLL